MQYLAEKVTWVWIYDGHKFEQYIDTSIVALSQCYMHRRDDPSLMFTFLLINNFSMISVLDLLNVIHIYLQKFLKDES
jgi:hypothetical protein